MSTPEQKNLSHQAGRLTTLFLRVDGTLLVARGVDAIELRLSPEQLLQLGMDALKLAVALQPQCLEAACAALDNTYIQPAGPAACLN